MDQPFPHPAQQVACQEYLDAANELEARVERLTGRIRDLVPSEHSSGSKRRQGAITKAGSPLARRMLVEGAWTYRLPARVSAGMRSRLEGLPREVRETAWKAQVRLCARYRRL